MTIKAVITDDSIHTMHNTLKPDDMTESQDSRQDYHDVYICFTQEVQFKTVTVK